MNILLTGANGYIGSRLLPLLLQKGHHVWVLVRHKTSFFSTHPRLTIIEADLLKKESLDVIPETIDVAYYFVHAMSYSKTLFVELEKLAIANFLSRLKMTSVKQIIYLSGLCNDKNLSPHLMSRYATEKTIRESGLPYTILRAGIIIGSGSASFEIIRDLVEKVPIMVAPKWVKKRCQPIAIEDVLFYLLEVVSHPMCLYQTFDIGGPECLSYKKMLLDFARIRGLKRSCIVVPVLTPKLSSYWLFFVTSVNFSLAYSLVDSVKNTTICAENRIKSIFPKKCLTYEESVRKALDTVDQNPLLPGWKDSLVSGLLESQLSELIKVPSHGCLTDQRIVITSNTPESVLQKLWSIGGDNGWFYMDWAWSIRGFIDKAIGGIGLNRGRTYPDEIQVGSSLDFWRVLVADKDKRRLLLFAEMKVPGEAWLEFNIEPHPKGAKLIQTATFRPKGLLGRLYWYSLFPVHLFIFQGMANAIAMKQYSSSQK